MFFALCKFEIFIPQGRSLKGKRSVVTGLKERLRSRFRASVVELSDQDLHQRGVLGVALVGTSPSALEDALAAMRRIVDLESRCSVTVWETRVEPFQGAPRAPRDGLWGACGSGRMTSADTAVGEEGVDGDDWEAEQEGDEFYGPGRDRDGKE